MKQETLRRDDLRGECFITQPPCLGDCKQPRNDTNGPPPLDGPSRITAFITTSITTSIAISIQTPPTPHHEQSIHRFSRRILARFSGGVLPRVPCIKQSSPVECKRIHQLCRGSLLISHIVRMPTHTKRARGSMKTEPMSIRQLQTIFNSQNSKS